MRSWSHDPILVYIGQRYRSHGHIMYTAKMCITQYWVIVTFEPTHSYFATNCLPCQRRLPSNGAKNSGLYDQFYHVL